MLNKYLVQTILAVLFSQRVQQSDFFFLIVYEQGHTRLNKTKEQVLDQQHNDLVGTKIQRSKLN